MKSFFSISVHLRLDGSSGLLPFGTGMGLGLTGCCALAVRQSKHSATAERIVFMESRGSCILIVRFAELALDAEDDLAAPMPRPLRVGLPAFRGGEVDDVVRATHEHLAVKVDAVPGTSDLLLLIHHVTSANGRRASRAGRGSGVVGAGSGVDIGGEGC